MTDLPREDFISEYESVVSRCGFLLLEHWTSVSITGADRATFLHNMCSNDIRKLGVGDYCEAFFTDVKGKILAHTIVIAWAEEIVLLTVPGQAEPLMSHLDRYVIREDVQLQNRAGEIDWILVVGPDAGLIVSQLEVTNQTVPFDAVCHVGFLIQCPSKRVQELSTLLKEAGAVQVSEAVWSAIRVESGLPLFGIDFDRSNLPQEIDRNEQAISFTKGCYLGQETIARIDALGHVNKQIVGLKFAGEKIPESGLKINHGNGEVGVVSSAVWSPREQTPFALAMLRRGSNEVGTVLNSNLGEATVVSLRANSNS